MECAHGPRVTFDGVRGPINELTTCRMSYEAVGQGARLLYGVVGSVDAFFLSTTRFADGGRSVVTL